MNKGEIKQSILELIGEISPTMIVPPESVEDAIVFAQDELAIKLGVTYVETSNIALDTDAVAILPDALVKPVRVWYDDVPPPIPYYTITVDPSGINMVWGEIPAFTVTIDRIFGYADPIHIGFPFITNIHWDGTGALIDSPIHQGFGSAALYIHDVRFNDLSIFPDQYPIYYDAPDTFQVAFVSTGQTWNMDAPGGVYLIGNKDAIDEEHSNTFTITSIQP